MWKLGGRKHSWQAVGTSYVTNQRVLFIRKPHARVEGKAVADLHAPLVTLSVPLDHYIDTRYMIPIFGAPYFEASVVPVPDGGLPTAQDPATPGAAPTGLLTTYFNEGGGIEFRSAVEEAKSRFDEARGRHQAAHFESLPEYTPEGGSAAAAATPSPSTSTAVPHAGALASSAAPEQLLPRDDVETAILTHEIEGQEQAIQSNPARRDAPPTYEPPPYTE